MKSKETIIGILICLVFLVLFGICVYCYNKEPEPTFEDKLLEKLDRLIKAEEK